MNNYRFPPTGWIWADDRNTQEHKLVLFRHVLTLNTLPETAVIKVSADSRYRLYVNDISVSFGPCKGDGQIWHYETVDITPLLKIGDNVLSAKVLRLSPSRKGNHSIWRTDYPGFYLHGEMCIGAETTPLVADESWKWKECSNIKFIPESGAMVYLDIFEKASGDVSIQGWTTLDYDMSDWCDAVPYSLFELPRGTSPANLLPRPIPQMFERPAQFIDVQKVRQSIYSIEKWSALLSGEGITLDANTEHVIEIDAGELTTGFLSMQFTEGLGADIEILTAESYVYLSEDRSLNGAPKKGNRTDCKNGSLHGFTDFYSVGGFGSSASPEYYETFWFRTFRFVGLKIKTGEQALQLKNFSYRETGYPLDVKTTVKTSDESLSAIWDISLRSLRRCMHETYEDCPFYEQLQYAMDARAQILFTYAVSADDKMARRTIDDFHRSLRYDGLTNCCWPTVTPNVIPSFSLFYIMMIYDHMMYFGDKDLVLRYLPSIDAILDFFSRNIDDRGLVGNIGGILFMNQRWSFVDWATQWERTSGVPDAVLQGPITMESLLYAYTLDMAEKLANYVGNKERSLDCAARANSIRAAVNEHCRDSEGIYLDGPGINMYSQHCQVWAVLSDTVPTENQKMIMEKAISEVEWVKCSVAMAFYLFRALEKSGLYDKTAALWEPWRDMIRDNLTTCQENDTDKRSDCHAWAALALYELPSVVLGVHPAKPGYAAISVNPMTAGYLTYAEGKVITPKGEVHVEWKLNGNEMQLNASAPSDIEIIK